MNVLIITSNKGKRHRNVTLFLHNLIEDTLKIKCVHISDGKHTEINHIINLVVCLNKDSVYFANYYANKKFHVPCIYFFTASSYIKDYPISMNLADRFVMIQDCYIQYDSMLPNCIKICQPCYDISKQNSSEIVVPQISVLIAIDSFMQDGITFFNIIKQINQLDQFNFTIIAPKCFSKWVNKNIRIEQKKNFELLCMNSSFIVGSGEYIFKAIKMHKPCIILGDRGYGGILDVLNFELQYCSLIKHYSLFIIITH